MKRISLMVFSAVLGIVLLAATARQLTATQSDNGPPGDNVGCYYNMYTCSYGDSWAYWDGCDPSVAEGWTPTSIAKTACRTYHSS